MLEHRFPGEGAHTFETFLQEMAGILAAIWHARPTARFILFPHILRDLAVYADLLARLPDLLRRDQVRVAAYVLAYKPHRLHSANMPPATSCWAEASTLMWCRSGWAFRPSGCPATIRSRACTRNWKRPMARWMSAAPASGPVLQARIGATDDGSAMKAQTGAMQALVGCQRAAAAAKISAWLTRLGLRRS